MNNKIDEEFNHFVCFAVKFFYRKLHASMCVPLCETDWQKLEKHGITDQNEFIDGGCVIL